MNVHEVLSRCRDLGVTLAVSPDGKLRVSPPGKLPEELKQQLRQRKGEVLALLAQKPVYPCFSPQQRGFLSRPLGQENNPDVWDAWGPFFDWLREHHPARFFAICDAEDTISALEREGVTTGEAYDAACAALLWLFEEARQLRMREGLKIWFQ